MLAASDPVISKRIVCGPGCSQGARIVYFQENEGGQARSNSFPGPRPITSTGAGRGRAVYQPLDTISGFMGVDADTSVHCHIMVPT